MFNFGQFSFHIGDAPPKTLPL